MVLRQPPEGADAWQKDRGPGPLEWRESGCPVGRAASWGGTLRAEGAPAPWEGGPEGAAGEGMAGVWFPLGDKESPGSASGYPFMARETRELLIMSWGSVICVLCAGRSSPISETAHLPDAWVCPVYACGWPLSTHPTCPQALLLSMRPPSALLAPECRIGGSGALAGQA